MFRNFVKFTISEVSYPVHIPMKVKDVRKAEPVVGSSMPNFRYVFPHLPKKPKSSMSKLITGSPPDKNDHGIN